MCEFVAVGGGQHVVVTGGTVKDNGLDNALVL